MWNEKHSYSIEIRFNLTEMDNKILSDRNRSRWIDGLDMSIAMTTCAQALLKLKYNRLLNASNQQFQL